MKIQQILSAAPSEELTDSKERYEQLTIDQLLNLYKERFNGDWRRMA